MGDDELFAACARVLGEGWRGEDLRCHPQAGRILEDEIERRELQARYVYALEGFIASRDHWEYMRVPLRLRCMAFLAAVRDD